jgi:hypothetical protein
MPDTASAKEKADAIAAEKEHKKEVAAGTVVDRDALARDIERKEKDLEAAKKQLAEASKDVFVKHEASTFELGGVTKQLREEGDSNTGKPDITHVVQQGGGGTAIDGNSGGPIR